MAICHFLQRLHPGPGFREPLHPAREDGEEEPRKRHAKPQREKHCDRDGSGLREREAERRTHEGSRTGARDNDGENPGEKASEEAARRWFEGEVAARAAAAREFEHTREIHRDREEEEREDENDHRVLKLKAPAKRRPCGLKRDQGSGKRSHGEEDARGKGETVPDKPAVI